MLAPFARTVAPPLAANPTAYLLRDLFTDANSTSIASHVMDVGGVWAQTVATAFFIQSNHLEPNRHIDADLAQVDAGVADGILTCLLRPYDSGSTASLPALIFRYSDASNYWLVQLDSRLNFLQFYKREAAAFTLIAQQTLVLNSATQYAVTVKLIGEDITVAVDGINEFIYVSTFNKTATRMGVRVGKTAAPADTCEWDDFTFTPFAGTNFAWPVFTKGGSNPVIPLGAGGTWEDVDVANPDVFYDTPNGRWVMNYSGYDGAEWHTGLAYSTDLLSWAKEAANPVLTPDATENTIAANGSIVLKAGTYYLYYQGNPGSRIYCATSTDLLTWVRQGVVLGAGVGGQWDDANVFDPMARLKADGVTIELYYAGSNAATARGVGLATSTDGLAFTRQGRLFATPLFAGIENNHGEPFVGLVSGNAYTLFFDGATVTDTRYINQAITTDGGITWAYRAKALEKSASGWDNVQVFDCCIVLNGTTLYMYFAGAALSGGGAGMGAKIGLATATVTGALA